jgi:hypothetical protein
VSTETTRDRLRAIQRAIETAADLIESAPTSTVRDAATTHYRELAKVQFAALAALVTPEAP